MAWEVPILGADVAYRASSNVTALTWTGNPPVYSSGGIPQYSVLTFDLATGLVGDVKLAAATNVVIAGISQDGIAAGTGQSIRARVSGQSKAIAGAAISVGDLLMVSAANPGEVITAAGTTGTVVQIVGQAVTSATAIGDVITVQLSGTAVTKTF